MVAAFREWAEMFLKPIPELVANGDDPSDNYSEAIKDYMMEGLILWRHALGDPREPFSLALEICRNRVRALRSAPGAQVWAHIDPTPCAFLSWLLEGKSDSELLESACKLSDWKKLSMYYASQALDVGLLQTLASRTPPSDWDATIADIRARKRWRLMADTYGNYVRLIIAADTGDTSGVKDAIVAGDAFYRKRARADVYEPAETEGGGPDNEHVVDYRLAAIIKTTCHGIRGDLFPLGYPHIWRWSS